ncbi:MAG: zf-HC2 domain-containing protein [Gemmatimonadales bacterium]
MSDRWMDRLSEYLDGELPDTERMALEAHLETCVECSTVLADLARVVARAGRVEPRAPGRDLWPGIAARIGARAPARPEMVDLTSWRAAGRWTFSLPQLAAAGIALMLLSGGTVWLLRSPATSPAPAPVATTFSGSPAPAINASHSVARSYTAAIADLEGVLAQGREQLDTATVRVIEQNLAVIDRAIAQAQRALEADPANLYLNTHLAETMRRKLDLLRQAATLVPVS